MSNEMKECLMECLTAHKEDFYRLAYSYVKSPNDALDIIQESIQKALLKLPTIQKKDSLKSWFYKIVVRTSIDFLRKQKKITLLGNPVDMERHIAAEDHYENMDLKQAIEKLPIKYKTVIVLRYFEDLTIQEIALIIGKNISTTKSRLYKSLQLLREEYLREEAKDNE